MVTCNEHGPQPETFVCQHVVGSLRDGQPRGFFWSAADDSRHGRMVLGMHDRHRAAGWEWTAEVVALAKVQLLCARCYERAKSLNGV